MTSSDFPTKPGHHSSSTSPHRWKRLVRRLALLLIVIASGAAGAWYWWEFRRPLPGLREINHLIARNRLDEAESICRTSLRRDPADARTRVLLARILAARGDTTGAAEQLHAVPDDSPRKLDALFHEGLSWFLSDHARKAESAWLAYLAHDPGPEGQKAFEERVETSLINLYCVEDRWDEAREIVWRAYDRISDPVGKRALAFMALRTHHDRFPPASTLETLRKYAAADPRDLHARLALARMAQAAGFPVEADAALAACRELASNDPRYLQTRFMVLAARKNGPELEAMLADPPKCLESLPIYWRTLGDRAFRQEHWADSSRAYRRALTLDPADMESTYRVALSEGRLGHQADAQAFQQRHRDLQRAYMAFTPVLNSYLDANSSPPPEGSPTVPEAARRLAELCHVMRWDRTAAAWRRIADQ